MIYPILILIIFMLHILFPIQNIFFGVDSQLIFDIPVTYLWGPQVSYMILNLAMILVAFITLTTLIKTPIKLREYRYNTSRVRGLAVYYFFTYLVMLIMWYLILKHGFNYGAVAVDRVNYSFLIELRLFAYLGFLFLALNFPSSIVTSKSKVTIALFVLTVVIFQTRSILAEIFFIGIALYLTSSRDHFRFIHFCMIFPIFFLPNLFVFLRQDTNFIENFGELFQFEYLILINNILAASIEYAVANNEGNIEFFNQLFLVIPSPIRGLLNINAENNQFYADIAASGGVTSGGFSLIGQLYVYFGYLFIVPLGLLLIHLRFCYLNFFYLKPKTNFHQIAFPLVLAILVLGLRNDFGVVLKQIVQLFLVCSLLNLFLRAKVQ